jgi:beta-N-acetylhexosaminidase
MKKTILTVILVIHSLSSFSQTNDSLSYQAAQMLMIGFRGTDLSQNEQIVSDISVLGIGGVILFEYDLPSKSRPRNITSSQQLQKLCADLQQLSHNKLFIAIDQEGGKVNRLKTSYGFPATVSAQYLGKSDNSDSTRFYAESMTQTLSDCGINLNFTPCIDLNINKECPVIGKVERSFSDNPDKVVKHAGIFVEAHRAHGILTCLKHFPGHGSSKNDSHDGFTDITNTWKNMELQPYKAMISSGMCDAVMSSHIFNAHLDADYPGTLSHKIITGILRDSLGWDGCIFSDDMNMGAITKNFGFKESIALAINAGVDVLVFSNNSSEGYDPQLAQKALNAILELVNEGVITEQRIEKSYRRIMRLKNNE